MSNKVMFLFLYCILLSLSPFVANCFSSFPLSSFLFLFILVHCLLFSLSLFFSSSPSSLSYFSSSYFFCLSSYIACCSLSLSFLLLHPRFPIFLLLSFLIYGYSCSFLSFLLSLSLCLCLSVCLSLSLSFCPSVCLSLFLFFFFYSPNAIAPS